MTDPDLLRKKLARIETSVGEIRRLADVERLSTDVKERRFLERAARRARFAVLWHRCDI